MASAADFLSVGTGHDEKIFTNQCFADNLRCDGRTCLEFRDLSLTKDVLRTCVGSCNASNGEAEVIVGIKADLVKPSVTEPNKGRISLSVSKTNSSENDVVFVHGTHYDLQSILMRMCLSDSIFDRSNLSVVSGVLVWHIYIDILVMANGGSLLDLASIAMVVALRSSELPHVDCSENPVMPLDDSPSAAGGSMFSSDLLFDPDRLYFKLGLVGKSPIPHVEDIPIVLVLGIVNNSAAIADFTKEESNAIVTRACAAVGLSGSQPTLVGLVKMGGTSVAVPVLNTVTTKILQLASVIDHRYLRITPETADPSLPPRTPL